LLRQIQPHILPHTCDILSRMQYGFILICTRHSHPAHCNEDIVEILMSEASGAPTVELEADFPAGVPFSFLTESPQSAEADQGTPAIFTTEWFFLGLA
jgi:hypothetical protein